MLTREWSFALFAVLSMTGCATPQAVALAGGGASGDLAWFATLEQTNEPGSERELWITMCRAGEPPQCVRTLAPRTPSVLSRVINAQDQEIRAEQATRASGLAAAAGHVHCETTPNARHLAEALESGGAGTLLCFSDQHAARFAVDATSEGGFEYWDVESSLSGDAQRCLAGEFQRIHGAEVHGDARVTCTYR